MAQTCRSKIQYRTKSGKLYDFDTELCFPHFGVDYNSRVVTPKGVATVVGVYNGFLWFHIEGESGATYWDNVQNYDDLISMGFTIIESDTLDVDADDEEDSPQLIVENEKQAMTEFSCIFEEKSFRDVVLFVGHNQKEFRAHKVILWARSGFFHAMFSSNMIEVNLNAVRLPQLSEEIFPKVLEYMYCGKTDTDNIVGLIEAASFLQIQSLMDDCTTIILKNLTVKTAFPILETSLKLQLDKVKIECMKMIEKHAAPLMKNEKLLQILSKEGLMTVLQSQLLYKISEMELMKGIILWVGPQCVEKKGEIVDLLQYIKFENMTPKELEEVESYQLLEPQQILSIRSKKVNPSDIPILRVAPPESKRSSPK